MRRVVIVLRIVQDTATVVDTTNTVVTGESVETLCPAGKEGTTSWACCQNVVLVARNRTRIALSHGNE